VRGVVCARLTLLGSYALFASSVLTINPSHWPLIALSRNVSIMDVSPSSEASMPTAKRNLFWTGMKFFWSRSRRSDRDMDKSDSPFRYMMSKACTITFTLLSSPSLTSFLRVDRIWNGTSMSFSESYATTSASRTKEVTPLSTQASRTKPGTSGNLSDVSSRLREKHLTAPASVWCTCTLSPSYLYSNVNLCPSSLFSTSPTLFVGLASIGSTGIPGIKLQYLCSSLKGYFNAASTMRS